METLWCQAHSTPPPSAKEAACPQAPANHQHQTTVLDYPPFSSPSASPEQTKQRLKDSCEMRVTRNWGRNIFKATKGTKSLYLAHLGKYFSNLLLSPGDSNTTCFPSDPVQAIRKPWFIFIVFLRDYPKFPVLLFKSVNDLWCTANSKKKYFFSFLSFLRLPHVFDVCCPVPQSSLVFRLNKT